MLDILTKCYCGLPLWIAIESILSTQSHFFILYLENSQCFELLQDLERNLFSEPIFGISEAHRFSYF